MARYKNTHYSQSRLVTINYDNQLFPGTLEYTIHDIINNHGDTSVFNDQYLNDDTGTPAYDPAVMLKIVLLAYSRSIISSRKIEQAITFPAKCELKGNMRRLHKYHIHHLFGKYRFHFL